MSLLDRIFGRFRRRQREQEEAKVSILPDKTLHLRRLDPHQRKERTSRRAKAKVARASRSAGEYPKYK